CPADPRPTSRRPSRRRRRAVVIAVAFAATAVVASTAVAVSQWYHSAVVKPRVTEHEYAGAQNWLTLPPGASWPEFKIEPNTVTGKGGAASRAVTVSKEAWECRRPHACARGLGALSRPQGADAIWAN